MGLIIILSLGLISSFFAKLLTRTYLIYKDTIVISILKFYDEIMLDNIYIYIYNVLEKLIKFKKVKKC